MDEDLCPKPRNILTGTQRSSASILMEWMSLAGRRPIEVQPGGEVIIAAKAPKSMRRRTISALVEGKSNKGLTVGQMLVEVQDGKAPIRLCNLSNQTAVVSLMKLLIRRFPMRHLNNSNINTRRT